MLAELLCLWRCTGVSNHPYNVKTFDNRQFIYANEGSGTLKPFASSVLIVANNASRPLLIASVTVSPSAIHSEKLGYEIKKPPPFSFERR